MIQATEVFVGVLAALSVMRLHERGYLSVGYLRKLKHRWFN